MKKIQPTVIGISGLSRCGKDTFVNISSDILHQHGYFPRRISFADPLKIELTGMLKRSGFSASVYTDDSVAKSAIRPLMVWWGCQRREESPNERYWIDQANDIMFYSIKDMVSNNIDTSKIVFLVSDCRFLNEAEWIQNERKGKIIHLQKYKRLKWFKFIKRYGSPPNQAEAKNDPIMQQISDVKTEWEHSNDISYRRQIVCGALNSLKLFNETLS